MARIPDGAARRSEGLSVKKQSAPQKIVYRDPKTLKVDPRNARKHDAAQIEQLRKSYREFGWTRPILLRPSGMIGAGHGAHEMALAEGVASVPTITLAHFTQERACEVKMRPVRTVLHVSWGTHQIYDE